MKRRDFLASSLAASASAGMAYGEPAGGGQGMVSAGVHEFYELRYYQLHRGPGVKLTHDYLRDAAIPALNRAGIRETVLRARFGEKGHDFSCLEGVL